VALAAAAEMQRARMHEGDGRNRLHCMLEGEHRTQHYAALPPFADGGDVVQE